MNFKDLSTLNPNFGFYSLRNQLEKHVYGLNEKTLLHADEIRQNIKTRPILQKRQVEIRKTFLNSIDALPHDSKSPLNAKVTGIVQADGFHIEKIIFESRPNVFVTCNLYVPANIKKPVGAVLFMCGHHVQGKHTPEYQIVCRYLVKAGLVVLAQDPIGQGERFSYYEPSLKKEAVRSCCMEHDYVGSQVLAAGGSLARYFVHDSMRSLDYLLSRPEVDPRRIGITGNSGGGTQTSMMMLADERLAAAAPCTFIMNKYSFMHTGMAQDAEQIWPGTTAQGLDHEDILLVMAPKPVLVLAVNYDFFPIEGTRRTVEHAKRFWEIFGKSENLVLVEDDSVHAYTRKLAAAAAAFFSKYLNGKQIDVPSSAVAAIDPAQPKPPCLSSSTF